MPEAAARIGAILLAAGLGRRFGPAPKLLAFLDGRPLVRHAAQAVLGSGLRPAVAVVGARAEAIRAALDGLGLDIVENPDPSAGLAGSLRAGLVAMPAEVDAVAVVLADMPGIRAAHLHALASAYEAAAPRPAAVVPVHGGRRGNPVLLNLRLLRPALEALEGDAGAGRLLRGREDVLEIPGEPAHLLDVDTPEALAALGSS